MTVKRVTYIVLVFLIANIKGFCQDTKTLDQSSDEIVKKSKLTSKDFDKLGSENTIDYMFHKIVNEFDNVFKFNDINPSQNKLDLFYGRTPLLKGKMKNYYLWMSIVILMVVLYADFFKFTASKNKQEIERNLPISKVYTKYIIIASVMLCPALFTSVIVGMNRLIVLPIDYFMKPIDEEGAAKKKIDVIKTYNYYSSILYKDAGVLTDAEFENTVGKIETKSLLEKIWETAKVNMYYGVVSFINFLQNIIDFVLYIISNLMVYILAIFFPLVVLLNYIPTFSGGISSVIKYVVNFSLFPVVAKLLRSLTDSFGTGMLVSKLEGILDSPISTASVSKSYEVIKIINENMTFGNIAIMIMMLVMTAITPKITDMLIVGSQSGGFFSAVTAMSAAAISKGLSAAGMATKGGLDFGKGIKSGIKSGIKTGKISVGEGKTNLSKTAHLSGSMISGIISKMAKGTYNKKK